MQSKIATKWAGDRMEPDVMSAEGVETLSG